MSEMITATYKNGTLVLDEPLEISDGAKVAVTVFAEQPSKASAKRVGEILAKIAALPVEGKTDPFSGRDHDKVLYGEANEK